MAVVEYAPSQQGDAESILLWTLTYTPPNQNIPVTLKGSVRILTSLFFKNLLFIIINYIFE